MENIIQRTTSDKVFGSIHRITHQLTIWNESSVNFDAFDSKRIRMDRLARVITHWTLICERRNIFKSPNCRNIIHLSTSTESKICASPEILFIFFRWRTNAKYSSIYSLIGDSEKCCAIKVKVYIFNNEMFNPHIVIVWYSLRRAKLNAWLNCQSLWIYRGRCMKSISIFQKLVCSFFCRRRGEENVS